MQLYTFTARSLAEALRVVREELGPDASLLHTREVGSPLARLICGRTIEVTAAAEPCAPSRLNELTSETQDRRSIVAAELQDFRRAFRDNVVNESKDGVSLVEQLALNRSGDTPHGRK
jgi:flagellar biosynthesis GTPase FlhF